MMFAVRRSWLWVGLLLAGMAASGCGPGTAVPRYHWSDDRAAVQELATRAKRVKSFVGEATVRLQRKNGDSVRLDSVIVAEFPNRVRLRAWKFGQAVLDLTMTPEGTWMVRPEDPSRRERVLPASISAAQFARGWAMVAGDLADPSAITIQRVDGDTVCLHRDLGSGMQMLTDVDRAHLTISRQRLLDNQGTTRFTLVQDHYRMFGEIVWPMRLTAISEQGTIVVEFDNVEFNTPPAPGAFTPPGRAEKLP